MNTGTKDNYFVHKSRRKTSKSLSEDYKDNVKKKKKDKRTSTAIIPLNTVKRVL